MFVHCFLYLNYEASLRKYEELRAEYYTPMKVGISRGGREYIYRIRKNKKSYLRSHSCIHVRYIFIDLKT